MKWIYGYLAVGAMVAIWFCLTVTEEEAEGELDFPFYLGGAVFYVLFWPVQLFAFVRAAVRGEL